ncbi:MAG: hypothetical protein ACE5NP_01915 [Anaerolineae bacterium]
MTTIRCRFDGCIHWLDEICTAEMIEYDPDEGCLTMEERDELLDESLEWEDEDWLEELEEEEENWPDEN